jgi:hypothetical protein
LPYSPPVRHIPFAGVAEALRHTHFQHLEYGQETLVALLYSGHCLLGINFLRSVLVPPLSRIFGVPTKKNEHFGGFEVMLYRGFCPIHVRYRESRSNVISMEICRDIHLTNVN